MKCLVLICHTATQMQRERRPPCTTTRFSFKLYAVSLISSLSLVSACRQEQLPLILVNGTISRRDVDSREEPVAHFFRVQNNSKTSITIEEVQTGCACTSSDFRSRELAPGEFTTIDIVIDSFSGYENSYKGHAMLRSSAGSVLLRMEGSLPPATDVRYRPKQIYISDHPDGGEVKRILRVRVPKACGDDCGVKLIFQDGQPVEYSVTQLPSSPYYCNYNITFTLNTLLIPRGKQRVLHVNSSCGLSEVAIHHP